MKIHPRYFIVRDADRPVADAVEVWAARTNSDSLGLLLTLDLYATDLVRRIAGMPRLHTDALDGLDTMLTTVQNEHDLTDIELYCLVLERQHAVSKDLLRLERHPNDPDRYADQSDED